MSIVVTLKVPGDWQNGRTIRLSLKITLLLEDMKLFVQKSTNKFRHVDVPIIVSHAHV